jgi:hypothetical protein
VRPDIVPGGAFPDYALPDHTGTVRMLSELQGRDPLIRVRLFQPAGTSPRRATVTPLLWGHAA